MMVCSAPCVCEVICLSACSHGKRIESHVYERHLRKVLSARKAAQEADYGMPATPPLT